MGRERQYASAAERQAAYRNRKRNEQPAIVTQSRDVTPGVLISEREITVRRADRGAIPAAMEDRGWNVGRAYTVRCCRCSNPLRIPPSLGAYVRCVCGRVWVNTADYTSEAIGRTAPISQHSHEWYRQALTQSEAAQLL